MQYIAIDHGKTVSVIRLDTLKEQPCSRFEQYKAVRAPHCCKPCLNKYVEAQKVMGRTVVTLPEGMNPFTRNGSVRRTTTPLFPACHE